MKVSDDEDDTHPNIDTPSLFRWRHQARVERDAQFQEEKEKFQKDFSKHLSDFENTKQALEKAKKVHSIFQVNLVIQFHNMTLFLFIYYCTCSKSHLKFLLQVRMLLYIANL